MTDMYDEKKVADFTLPPYQHEDHGSVSNAVPAAVGKSLVPPDSGRGDQSGRARVPPMEPLGTAPL